MEAMYDGQAHWFTSLAPAGGNPVGFPEAAEIVEGTTESWPLLHGTHVSSVHPGQAVVYTRVSELLAAGVVALAAVWPHVLRYSRAAVATLFRLHLHLGRRRPHHHHPHAHTPPPSQLSILDDL